MNTSFPRTSPAHEVPIHASFTAFAVVFVTLLVSCPVAVAASEEVTFKGSLEGDVTLTPLDPPLEFVLIEGTGNATQVGQFTVEIPHVVNFATSTGSGSFEFTAANGDTLTATFTGQASLTETPGVLSIVETA